MDQNISTDEVKNASISDLIKGEKKVVGVFSTGKILTLTALTSVFG